MTPTSFRTQPLPLQDQFEAWREWYTTVFDVVAEPPSSGEFSAEIHLWTLDGLAMSRTIAPSVDVVRTKHHLRHNPVDHWIISYCARGAHSARTADIDVEVPRACPTSGHWDKNSCICGRMSTESSLSWRGTHSAISRLCSMLLAG